MGTGLATGLLLAALWAQAPSACERAAQQEDQVARAIALDERAVAGTVRVWSSDDLVALAAQRADQERQRAEARAARERVCAARS